MNVRIFKVHTMECKCVQTRPQFMLSSNGIGNGVRPHVNSKGKVPSTKGSEEGLPHDAASRSTASPTHYSLSYSGLHDWLESRLFTADTKQSIQAVDNQQLSTMIHAWCELRLFTADTKQSIQAVDDQQLSTMIHAWCELRLFTADTKQSIQAVDYELL